MAFHVYILRSRRNGRLYTGSTDNLERRVAEHNSGRSKATRFTGPFDLLHSESFDSRSAAVARERYLKTGLGRQEIIRLLDRQSTEF